MKYYIIKRTTSGDFVWGLYDTFEEATKRTEQLLQDDAQRFHTFEIVAKVAEIKRAPHPVQIKLSRVLYDA